jgi:hypothetical protein
MMSVEFPVNDFDMLKITRGRRCILEIHIQNCILGLTNLPNHILISRNSMLKHSK